VSDNDLQIKLDWYKDYGIEVVESMRLYEDYKWKSDVAEKRLEAKSFYFIGAWGREMVENLKGDRVDKLKVLEYIEKLELARTILGPIAAFDGEFISIGDLIKTEGAPANKVDFYAIAKHANEGEDVEQSLGELIDKGINKNSKLIFQSRMPWTIQTYNNCERCGAPNPHNDMDIKTIFRSRFVFGILPKEAKLCLK
jgi:hypothetical protein